LSNVLDQTSHDWLEKSGNQLIEEGTKIPGTMGENELEQAHQLDDFIQNGLDGEVTSNLLQTS